MNLPVLTGVRPDVRFHAMVGAIAERLRPEKGWIAVLLDDLPDSSARLDLVRLAVIAALERRATSFRVLPVTACDWNQVGGEWLISRVRPARGFTFRNGAVQPPERTVTLAESGFGTVQVRIHGAQAEVWPPSERECRRLLGSGARGTPLRFPVFPSSGPSMIARGRRRTELVLWRCGLPATKFRLPGPVLAATHVSGSSSESLIALIETDRSLVVHVEGDEGDGLHELHVPIDFRVARDARRDLSPLYLDMDEPWDFGVYFRRAGQWWRLRRRHGDITLTPSFSRLHQPGSFPFHTVTRGADEAVLGPGHSWAVPDGSRWRTRDDTFITAGPDEDVLGLTEIDGGPALLTRAGDLVRARTADGVRTVVEFAGPLVLHHHLPWVAVQRSAHLVEVLDIATGAVLHRLGTA